MSLQTILIITGIVIAVSIILMFLSIMPLLRFLKYIGIALLVIVLLASGAINAYAIYKYQTATGYVLGLIPLSEVNTDAPIESATYTGKNYGFNWSNMAFNIDNPSEPYLRIVYEPMTINLLQNYYIFANGRPLTKINKANTFIEGDFVVNFYNSTDLSNAIEGNLHIQYVFNEKQTYVTLTASSTDYAYWTNYLKTNSLLTTVETYSPTINELPDVDELVNTMDISSNTSNVLNISLHLPQIYWTKIKNWLGVTNPYVVYTIKNKETGQLYNFSKAEYTNENNGLFEFNSQINTRIASNYELMPYIEIYGGHRAPVLANFNDEQPIQNLTNKNIELNLYNLIYQD